MDQDEDGFDVSNEFGPGGCERDRGEVSMESDQETEEADRLDEADSNGQRWAERLKQPLNLLGDGASLLWCWDDMPTPRHERLPHLQRG